MVHDPGRGFGKLTRVDPIYHHHLNVKIKICHLEFFYVKLCFYRLSKLPMDKSSR
jgi:hypothetical protein